LRLCAPTFAFFLLVSFGARTARAQAEPGDKLSCKWNPDDTSQCAPLACNPPANVDENMVAPGATGFCGKCRTDRACGGARCNLATGRCSQYDSTPPPQPVWPHFHLLVTDATFNFLDADSPKPIVGAGYLFQGAFGKTNPQKFDGGGYFTPELPHTYWDVGASVAFAGPAQNLFANAGLTRYAPGAPLAITTLSLGLLFQRQGASIWKPANDTVNEDRLGPTASVGLLQNVFVRVSYVFPLRGPNDHGALLVGVTYLKDLLGDLVPDRFRKFLPAQLK
jgi:hypothetical protein